MLAEISADHRKMIYEKLLMLDSLKNVQLACSLKAFSGPYFCSSDIEIYGIHVHTKNRVQYRLPFAPFLDSYVVLSIHSRKDLDFKKLTVDAIEKYKIVLQNEAAYVRLDLPSENVSRI